MLNVAAHEGLLMTYVVVENCIKCKYLDCVEIWQVDCFYEGDDVLIISPGRVH